MIDAFKEAAEILKLMKQITKIELDFNQEIYRDQL
jgi:hypothetical protein